MNGRPALDTAPLTAAVTPALLVLENGSCYPGESVGAPGLTGGELVFNTGMTGYQEILTDPSYKGQIVTMTCPEIGNYGTSREDIESRSPAVAGFVMREASPLASNWRSDRTLRGYLVAHSIVAIAGVDTRALTRTLRSAGVMRAVIATGEHEPSALVARAQAVPSMVGADLVGEVTCRAPFVWPAAGAGEGAAPDGLASAAVPFAPEIASRGARPGGGAGRLVVAAIDFGMKWNILRRLAAYGCRVHVFPAGTSAGAVLAAEPDGVFLSNGPGDPAALTSAHRVVRDLVDAGRPIFGICLGHQILALALGGRTYKLKFGHRGVNHPVKDLAAGSIDITSQNHGFAVDAESLPKGAELTHVSLYDGTVEGFRLRDRPVFCVQFHPEASPGPHDADHHFARFVRMMEERRARAGG